MGMGPLFWEETLTHRLVLPRDANHYGTLFAGSLLALALESAYAAAYRSIGPKANLVLKRVLDLRCYQPVKIGHVVEIRARPVFEARAQVIIGLHGTALPGRPGPWMDGLMQFAQVDSEGRPVPIEGVGLDDEPREPFEGRPWGELRARALRLRTLRA